MNSETNLRYQVVSAWSGVIMLILYGVFWDAVGHGAPAPTPTGFAAFYVQNHLRILLGMTLASITGGLWIIWSSERALLMRRIESCMPVLALI
jgi:hypothetical protein